jgi:hypothetical protein
MAVIGFEIAKTLWYNKHVNKRETKQRGNIKDGKTERNALHNMRALQALPGD